MQVDYIPDDLVLTMANYCRNPMDRLHDLLRRMSKKAEQTQSDGQCRLSWKRVL